ncbi:MAG: sigma-70 family RNA polymerase sigma factor [Planctomycetia bacterium]|nr:sigma-70 family RNA polymerase sigma factor [Planctomycetia bacterium]
MPQIPTQQRFTQLFAESEQALYGFVFSLLPNRADADDVLQETLARLWEHFDQYDPQRPFLPWACTFAYRQVLKHRRDVRIQGRHFSDALVENLSAGQIQDPNWGEAHQRAVTHCLDRLGPDDRRLVHARYFVDASLDRLAGELGQTANSLYKQLQRARVKLMNCITRTLATEGWAEAEWNRAEWTQKERK